MSKDRTPSNDYSLGPEDWSYRTLLEVQAQADTLILRFGTVILTLAEPVWQPSSVLELHECYDNLATVLNVLQNAIGQQCDYKCRNGGSLILTTLWLDYEVEELEIHSSSFMERDEEISTKDLQIQFARLARMYRQAFQACRSSERSLYRFRKGLDTALTNEITRSQQKHEFFASTRTEKAEQYRLQLMAYQHIQSIIEHIEQEAKSVQNKAAG